MTSVPLNIGAWRKKEQDRALAAFFKHSININTKYNLIKIRYIILKLCFSFL